MVAIQLEDRTQIRVNDPYVCPYEDCKYSGIPNDVNYNEAFTNMCCEIYECPSCNRQWGIE